MVNALREYLTTHTGLGDDEVACLAARMDRQRLDKGGALLAPGQVCDFNAFVASGCLRVCAIDDAGNPGVLSFAPEGSWATDVESFVTGSPSALTIDAVEPTDVLVIGKTRLAELRAETSWAEGLVRTLQERTLVQIQRRVVASLRRTATERYRDFAREYPGLEQRIAQYHIAASVGVSAEFLSTLRRRASGK
jgi:CRP-like cAMP-binding protein